NSCSVEWPDEEIDPMLRIIVWFSLVFVPAVQASVCRADEPKKRPNIVFLLADDLRWNVLGCTGDKLAITPNLDALAKRGVLFRHHFGPKRIAAAGRATFSPAKNPGGTRTNISTLTSLPRLTSGPIRCC